MALQTKSLQETLANLGLLNSQQLQTLQQEMQSGGKSVEDILLQKNMLSEEIIAKAKAVMLDVPFIDLSSAKIDNELLKIIPEKVSKTYMVIPFHKDESKQELRVAMLNPADFQTLEFLEKRTNCRIEPYMAIKSQIEKIQSSYGSLSGEVSAALQDVDDDSNVTISMEGEDQLKENTETGDAPVARIVNTILEYAIKSHASDIHIEPMETRTRVRYRIDGVMQETLTIPKQVHPAISSRIKIMSKLKIDEKRVPQDGRFRVTVQGKDSDLRVSTLPLIFGEKIVMRILDRSTEAPTLEKLGYTGLALNIIKEKIQLPNGLILTTGPTGSGKSTSLFALLTMVNKGTVNTITLEDPVEYWINGVNQVQINAQAGLTFAAGLRSVLRQDPDIVMVGEIRDQETAEMAIHAALTGHLVVSTLHTNSAAGAIPRFLDMGVESFLLASSLKAVIGQRLARHVCRKCIQKYEATADTQEKIKNVIPHLFDLNSPYRKIIMEGYPKLDQNIGQPSQPIYLYKGAGCDECGGNGYKGRVGLYEVLNITPTIEEMTIANKPANEIELTAQKEYGMITLKQDGFLKALEGLTTLEDAMRVAES